jgi:predicted negative regulator of RcsB-dependent stress response
MAKKKVTRKELLKKPDEFMSFSSRAAEFVALHLRQIKIVGIVIGIGLVLYLAGYMYLRHVNKKGQEVYNSGYYALAEFFRPEGTSEKLQQSETHFEKLIDEYGLSKAARLALPHVAYLKFVEEKYDEAIESYQKYLEQVSQDREYASLTRLALSACYEAKGELQTARKTLEPILEGPDDGFKETAMLSMARLFRLDNQDEKSKKILKKFVEKFQNSSSQPFAKAHL